MVGLISGYSFLPRRSPAPPDMTRPLFADKLGTSPKNQSEYASVVNRTLSRLQERGTLTSAERELLEENVNAWLLSDPVECLNRLSEMSCLSLIDNQALADALEAAARKDPMSLLRLANQVEDSKIHDWIFKTAIVRLAEHESPEVALRALDAVPARLRFSLGEEMGTRLANRLGPKAWAQLLATSRVLDADVVKGMLTVLSKNDPAAALRMLLDTPEAQLRTSRGTKLSLIASFGTMGKFPPELMLQTLESMPSSSFRKYLYTTLSSDLLAKSPDAVGKLIEQSKGDNMLIDAVAIAAQKAVYKSPQIAADIVNGLPGERQRNQVATNIVSSVYGRRPKEAVQWASQITDPVTRHSALTTASRQWINRAPGEAVAYATSAAASGNNSDLLHAMLPAISDSVGRNQAAAWRKGLSPADRQSILAEGARTLSPDKQTALAAALK